MSLLDLAIRRLEEGGAVTLARAPEGYDAFVVAELTRALAKAAVLMTLNRPAEAEQAARRALQLSPGLIEAHYLIGAALVVQEKVTPLNWLTPLNRLRLAEAAEHLRIAACKLPQAQPFLAAAQAQLAESQNH